MDGSDFEDSKLDPSMEAVLDIDTHPEDYDISAWSLEHGDAIVFDFRTLHGTGNAEITMFLRIAVFASRYWISTFDPVETPPCAL